jgi:hypothetical protein
MLPIAQSIEVSCHYYCIVSSLEAIASDYGMKSVLVFVLFLPGLFFGFGK